MPQWTLYLEEPHGANDLDSQARRRAKESGGRDGVHLRAPVSGPDTERQAQQGQGLESATERHRERWRDVSSAFLRFVWKKLQQRARENGQRARAGVGQPLLRTLPYVPSRKEHRISGVVLTPSKDNTGVLPIGRATELVIAIAQGR